MTKTILTTAALMLLSVGAIVVPGSTATAQDAILAEIYGRGVHAFYAGQSQEAQKLLSMAIDNGTKDPRAYYFRGLVSTMQGDSYSAESDWQKGAEIEARGSSNPAIGRSLSRFQGSARLKLEQIRQTARLASLSSSITRSDVRRNELRATNAAPLSAAPLSAAPLSATPMTAAPAAATGAAVAPPAAPPIADDDPFKDDSTSMAVGDAKIESDDALEGTMEPFNTGPVAGGPATPAGDPFGGGGGDAPAADPFGGGATTEAPAGDPFGGSGDGGAMGDPFGSDPFGN